MKFKHEISKLPIFYYKDDWEYYKNLNSTRQEFFYCKNNPLSNFVRSENEKHINFLIKYCMKLFQCCLKKKNNSERP